MAAGVFKVDKLNVNLLFLISNAHVARRKFANWHLVAWNATGRSRAVKRDCVRFTFFRVRLRTLFCTMLPFIDKNINNEIKTLKVVFKIDILFDFTLIFVTNTWWIVQNVLANFILITSSNSLIQTLSVFMSHIIFTFLGCWSHFGAVFFLFFFWNWNDQVNRKVWTMKLSVSSLAVTFWSFLICCANS